MNTSSVVLNKYGLQSGGETCFVAKEAAFEQVVRSCMASLLPGESRYSSFPEGISHQMIGWLNGWSLFSKAEKNWVHHPSRLASYKAVLIFRNAIMSQWWELNLTKKNFAQEKVHWCSKGQVVLFTLVQVYVQVQRPQLYKVMQNTADAVVLFLQWKLDV